MLWTGYDSGQKHSPLTWIKGALVHWPLVKWTIWFSKKLFATHPLILVHLEIFENWRFPGYNVVMNFSPFLLGADAGKGNSRQEILSKHYPSIFNWINLIWSQTSGSDPTWLNTFHSHLNTNLPGVWNTSTPPSPKYVKHLSISTPPSSVFETLGFSWTTKGAVWRFRRGQRVC